METAVNPEAYAGIITERQPVQANRILNAVSILVPLGGSALAIWGWTDLGITATSVGLFIGFFLAQIVGAGIGLHRYFTHKAFETGKIVRLALAILGSWAMQGPIDRWVADHRRHHRYADKPFDPHSPHWVNGHRPSSRLNGLLHAHVGWMLTGSVSDPSRYAADIRRDVISSWCSRHYWLLCTSSLVCPAVLGFLLGGPDEAMRGLLLAGCLRVSLFQQLTWSVNSIGHMFGESLPESTDESRNITLFAILLFGDGLHSYHHAYPSSGVNLPSHLDVNGWILRGLERVGLVWRLRRYQRVTSSTE